VKELEESPKLKTTSRVFQTISIKHKLVILIFKKKIMIPSSPLVEEDFCFLFGEAEESRRE
jgi:hypothetical protein